ncbi:hypothetical protein J6590_094807 [Homalodisca vitripennis]|nr:hypothetical protein J6590_094807 [Homalodisca vitripennis]
MLADGPYNAVSVAMEHWSVQHRVFVVEQFFRNNDSVVTVQRLFRQYFRVGRRGAVPDRNTVLRWVAAFRSTGSVMKKKPPGLPRLVRTPENVVRKLKPCRMKCWREPSVIFRRGSIFVSSKKDVFSKTLFS